MQYLTVEIKAIFVRTQRLLGFVRKEAVIVFPAGAEDHAVHSKRVAIPQGDAIAGKGSDLCAVRRNEALADRLVQLWAGHHGGFAKAINIHGRLTARGSCLSRSSSQAGTEHREVGPRAAKKSTPAVYLFHLTSAPPGSDAGMAGSVHR